MNHPVNAKVIGPCHEPHSSFCKQYNMELWGGGALGGLELYVMHLAIAIHNNQLVVFAPYMLGKI
jgi:hypothetical protein